MKKNKLKIKVWAISHYYHYEGRGTLNKYFINKIEAFEYLSDLVKEINKELLEEEKKRNKTNDPFYKKYPIKKGKFEFNPNEDCYVNNVIHETYGLDQIEIEIVGLEK